MLPPGAPLGACALAVLAHATVLARLHPYEYVAYNSLAGSAGGSVGLVE